MVTSAHEILEQLADVKAGVTVGPAVDDAVIAVLTPAVKAGAVIVGKELPVAEVPPDQRIKFRLQDLAGAVGKEETVHQAGGLFAGIGGNGIILRANQLDIGAGCAEIIGELLPEIGGVIGPEARGLEQGGVVFLAGI